MMTHAARMTHLNEYRLDDVAAYEGADNEYDAAEKHDLGFIGHQRTLHTRSILNVHSIRIIHTWSPHSSTVFAGLSQEMQQTYRDFFSPFVEGNQLEHREHRTNHCTINSIVTPRHSTHYIHA